MGLLVAALALGGVELGLRVGLGPPPPPVRVYDALQDAPGWFLTNDKGVHALYQRGFSIGPFPGQVEGPRAAVIGGSSVRGGNGSLKVDGEFPALLGQRLGLPVLNLGAPGLDSHDLAALTPGLLEQAQIDLLIVYTGHNDFGNAWFQSRFGDVPGGLRARALAGLERLQLFVQLRRLLTPPAAKPLRGAAPLPWTFDRLWATARYLEQNLRQICFQAGRAGVPVLLVAPASDLQRAPVERRCGDGPCAATVWESAASADPEARGALLRRARDLDPAPLRAPGIGVDAVRAVGRTESGVTLVDAELGLPQESGAPARALFVDHMHFSAEGHAAMAALLEAPARAALQARPR